MAKTKCAIGYKCRIGPADDWFSIVLVNKNREIFFCPQHSLAAEVLQAIGFGGEDIIARIRIVQLTKG